MYIIYFKWIGEEEQIKGEDGSEEESDNTETVNEIIKESTPHAKRKDEGSRQKSEVTEMEELDQKILKTLNKPVARKEVVDVWWKRVVEAFQLKKN